MQLKASSTAQHTPTCVTLCQADENLLDASAARHVATGAHLCLDCSVGCPLVHASRRAERYGLLRRRHHLAQHVDGQHLGLVPEQRVHVRAIVQAPELDRPVETGAEQLVRALPERQPRDDVLVPWEALCISLLNVNSSTLNLTILKCTQLH